MNIFVLDENLEKCVEYYCNRHMKIIVEIGQLLCQTRRELGEKSHISYQKINQGKAIISWLKKNPQHYYWTVLLCEHLCREYTFRYNKIHATSRVIKECKESFFAGNIPYFFPVSNDIPVYNTLDCPALAMPDEFKFKNDAVKSYRHYYALNKFFTIDFRYKRRQQPEWISEIQNENKEIVRRYKESNT